VLTFKIEELNEMRQRSLTSNEPSVYRMEASILGWAHHAKRSLDSVIEEIFEKAFIHKNCSMSYYAFLQKVLWLLKGDNYDLFMRLSKDCSRGFFEVSDWIFDSEATVYLRSLDLIKATKSIHQGPWFSPEEYVRIIRDSATVPLNKELLDIDIEESVSDFQKFLKKHHVEGLPESASLYILREFYGEKVLMELISKMHYEDVVASFSDLMDLLKDWEKLKQYPLDWAVSLR
jgi:hypothetical protein